MNQTPEVGMCWCSSVEEESEINEKSLEENISPILGDVCLLVRAVNTQMFEPHRVWCTALTSSRGGNFL